MKLSDVLADWLKIIGQEHLPGANITALNFGMLHSDKGYMVYLTGAEVYDQDDDDWAGEIDYQPPRKIKYLLIPREFTQGLKWKGVLELVVSALKELVAATPGDPLFAGRAVTASFDDEALELIKR